MKRKNSSRLLKSVWLIGAVVLFSSPYSMASLGDGETSLFDADGSAIVVHAEPDDYKTDPSGNSGDRIACGVIAAGK